MVDKFSLVKVIILDGGSLYDDGVEYLAVKDAEDDEQPYGIIIDAPPISEINDLIELSNEMESIAEGLTFDWIHWAFASEVKCGEKVEVNHDSI